MPASESHADLGLGIDNEWFDHTQDALKEQLAGIDIAVSAMVGSIKLLENRSQHCLGRSQPSSTGYLPLPLRSSYQ
jgi:hypothetical protein